MLRLDLMPRICFQSCTACRSVQKMTPKICGANYGAPGTLPHYDGERREERVRLQGLDLVRVCGIVIAHVEGVMRQRCRQPDVAGKQTGFYYALYFERGIVYHSIMSYDNFRYKHQGVQEGQGACLHLRWKVGSVG